MNVPPWLLFALVLTLGLALLYQLVSGRLGRRVIAYWAVILAGFLGGEIVCELADWNITRLGDLRLGPDLAGAVLVLFLLWFMRL